IPAAADTKKKAAAADLINGGNELRGLDGIALLHEQDASAELDALGCTSGSCEDHERIHGLGILFGKFTAAGEWSLARERNMGVLGRLDAIEAPLLQCDCQLRSRHRILGKEHCAAELHVFPPFLAIHPNVDP